MAETQYPRFARAWGFSIEATIMDANEADIISNECLWVLREMYRENRPAYEWATARMDLDDGSIREAFELIFQEPWDGEYP